MFPDRKNAGFLVEVVDGGLQTAAGNGTESGVLSSLKLGVGGVAEERRPGG